MIYRPEVMVRIDHHSPEYSGYKIGGEDACPACSKLAEVEYERYQRFEAMKK
tara:strand:+ start:695 stop:850 length:156 start_codon:yes stop_codon:yes gene_type:complete